jgi:hypothetical protein
MQQEFVSHENIFIMGSPFDYRIILAVAPHDKYGFRSRLRGELCGYISLN